MSHKTKKGGLKYKLYLKCTSKVKNKSMGVNASCFYPRMSNPSEHVTKRRSVCSSAVWDPALVASLRLSIFSEIK